MSGVTQVVGPEESPVFHNRLTHTHEVAQIAKRLAERVLAVETKAGRLDRINALGGLDPTTVEAAALAHDLGHPPFGHIGEQALDSVVRESGLKDGFEGNAQTFRILTKLAIRYTDQPGLNLTRATLNASLKYPWQRGEQGERYEKFGVYASEEGEFAWARTGLQSPVDAKTVEAEIVDWADDIAYAVGDLEDFFRAGLIPLDRIARDAYTRDKFISNVFERRAKKGIPLPNEQGLRSAFTLMIENAFSLSEPYRPTHRHRAQLRIFTSLLISRYINAFNVREPTTGNPRPVTWAANSKQEVTMLKELTWEYVIDNVRLASQQYGLRRVVRELFTIFRELANEQKRWYMLPISLRDSLEECESANERLRAVCDFVATLADQEAIQLYRRLTGIAPGSALDASLH